MKKSQIGQVMLVSVLALSVMTGCQSNSKAPKLIQSTNKTQLEAVATVRDISDTTARQVSVVGTVDYAAFAMEGTVDEICVQPGDQVKKGQVLAYLDTTEQDKELRAAKTEQSNGVSNHNATVSVLNEQIAKANYVYNHSDKKAKKLAAIEKKKAEENLQYENEQYEIQKGKSSRKIAEIEKVINDAKLVSTVNGKVEKYLEGFTIGAVVEPDIPVIRLINEERHCIQAPSNTSDEEGTQDVNEDYFKTQQLFFYTGTKQMAVEVYHFPAKIENKAGLCGDNLPVLLKPKKEEKLELGAGGYVVIEENSIKNVLAVPSDAIVVEDTKAYVYVKKNNQLKKAEVEIGKKTNLFTEIKKGINEGDIVSYTHYVSNDDNRKDLGDAKEKTTKVKKDDIGISFENDCKRASIKCEKSEKVKWTQESAILKSLVVKEGQKVTKGQVLAYMDMGVQQSQVLEAKMAVTNQRKSIEELVKGYRGQEKEFRTQEKQAKTTLEKKQVEFDKEIARKQYVADLQSANQSLNELQNAYQEISEQANGYAIKSHMDGRISIPEHHEEGEGVPSGASICTIDDTTASYTEVNLKNVALGNGFTVKCKLRENEKVRECKATVVQADYLSHLYKFRFEEPLSNKAQLQLIKGNITLLNNQCYIPEQGYYTEDIAGNTTLVGTCSYFVKKIENGKSNYSYVNIPKEYDKRVWVIEGLKENDEITYEELDQKIVDQQKLEEESSSEDEESEE